MEVGALTLLGALACLLGIVVFSAGSYNSLVRLRELVREAWQQTEQELDRRWQLVPDLAQGIRDQLPDEQIEAVLSAHRAIRHVAGNPLARARAEDELVRALGELLALAEHRPVLESDQGFQSLRCELAATEDRIAASRRFYNASVEALNMRIRGRSCLTALLVGIRRADCFEPQRRGEFPSPSRGRIAP